MQNHGLTIDALLDALAERVAAKIRTELAQNGDSNQIKPRLLSIEQAATYLGRSAHSVRYLVATGKIPCVRLDKRVFIDARDLDQLIEAKKQVAT